jgi:hypothetical protein
MSINQITSQYLIFVSLLFTLTANAQSKLMNSDYCYQKINLGYGPEDIVIDTITNPDQPKLLVSCNSRRKTEKDMSEIFVYDIKAQTTSLVKRIEPTDLCFNPHGIDLVNVHDSLILLVVSHCRANKTNSIVRYYWKNNMLYFLEKITDPLFTSPNAVSGFKDGSFLVSNDANKQGSIFEVLFKQKKAKVIYWNDGTASFADAKVCYGNGILVNGSTIYQASTMPGEVYQYSFSNGKLSNKTTIAKVKGADNIRLDGNNLVVAGHLKFGKFLKHMKNTNKKSPTAIFTINKESHEKNLIYYNSGLLISAASTGLIYNHKLYIAQVFDNFILEVNLDCHPKK